MLHDLLFALLGFTGDIIVLAPDPIYQLPTFRVKDGYAKLSDAEIEQMNQIAPLGWFYKQFQEYIQQYDMSWSNANSSLSLYKMALSAALQDLSQEYNEEIAELEEMVNREEHLPLTTFIIQLKNYEVTFPFLHKMLKTIEEQNLQGCQIIDYFANSPIGNPIINDVIER